MQYRDLRGIRAKPGRARRLAFCESGDTRGAASCATNRYNHPAADHARSDSVRSAP